MHSTAHPHPPDQNCRHLPPEAELSDQRTPPQTKSGRKKSKTQRNSAKSEKGASKRGGIEDVWNWECGEAALRAVGLGGGAFGIDEVRIGEGDRVCAQHMSMGQLLSKLEEEAEAVQLVALTKRDEECYVAKYLQVCACVCVRVRVYVLLPSA
eukprot:889550-Pelagomonas_calceolata.AAC.2